MKTVVLAYVSKENEYSTLLTFCFNLICYMCRKQYYLYLIHFEIYTYIFDMRSWNETKINCIGLLRNVFDSACNVALAETAFHGITCRKNKNIT